MKDFELLKLINNKKTLIAVAVLIFFALFLNSFISITNAQYEGDMGGYYYDYPSTGDASGYYYYDYYYDYDYDYDYDYYDYPSISYSGTYDYPVMSYETYIYPSLSYPGTFTYPTMSYGSYTYPSISYPGTYTYPPTTYGTYTYPSLTMPGTYTYPPTTYGTYTYPSLTMPGTYDYPSASYGSYSYPSISYPGGYNYWSFGGYPSTTAYAATIDQPANIPTGPEGTLPWVLLGGLVLSVVVYLTLFIIRFKGQFALTGADSNVLLARKLEKIRSEELKPDTSYDFQS